jgi:putative membrane protein
MTAQWGMVGLWGGLMMLVFWIVVIVGIFILLKWLIEQTKSSSTHPTEKETALDILKKRYAKGEIGKEEFDEKKKDLI